MSQMLIQKIEGVSKNAKWSWAARCVNNSEYNVEKAPLSKPEPGDLGLFRIKTIGFHKQLITKDDKKLRLYENDLFVGVFGNRYATDGFEGRVGKLDKLSMLTGAGMVGTVKYRHKSIKKSTKLSFVGLLKDENGNTVNLKKLNFHKSIPKQAPKNLILVVGSGMNSGKTTSASKLINGLSKEGKKIAACKLTGSVSNRDKNELSAASADYIIDFSDYGFPSTYLCEKKELVELFQTMLSDIEKTSPDVIVMEIADGVLQRETKMILMDKKIRNLVKGVVLTAESAPSALFSSQQLQNWDHNVIAVSGAITSSPLSSKEFIQNSEIKLVSSADSGSDLSDCVINFLKK
jgi:molybdopterin-guanine dinucleotide biosynthesis protein